MGGGPADVESARWILAQTKRIAENHGDEVDWLVDLSGITETSAESRKILVQSSGHPSIRKYAMGGVSTFIRVVSNFINAAAGQKSAQHFATEEEALRWLKGED